MVGLLNRRTLLQSTAAAGIAVAMDTVSPRALLAAEREPLFKISIAEWSFHRAITVKRTMTNLDFPVVAKRDYGIEAIEYVNRLFFGKGRDKAYLTELKQRCDDNGVRSVLIMCDDEGDLGAPNEATRRKAVENHHKWVEAAKFLGCHSIRVNARSAGSYEEQMVRTADGLRQLSEFADPYGINVIVENHGGLSSNAAWLTATIRKVKLPNCGTLPDFGNFQVSRNDEYDRYKGVAELMPYAKGVSAKSREFNEAGDEVQTDFYKMMKIVLDSGFHGYVGIEWEGEKPDEMEGVRLTHRLLEQVRDKLAADAF